MTSIRVQAPIFSLAFRRFVLGYCLGAILGGLSVYLLMTAFR